MCSPPSLCCNVSLNCCIIHTFRLMRTWQPESTWPTTSSRSTRKAANTIQHGWHQKVGSARWHTYYARIACQYDWLLFMYMYCLTWRRSTAVLSFEWWSVQQTCGWRTTCCVVALQRRGDDMNVKSADMWSYAIVLWELSTREVPFADMSPMEIGMKVCIRERLMYMYIQCDTCMYTIHVHVIEYMYV